MQRRTFLHHFIRTAIIGGLIWQVWIFIRSLFSDVSLQKSAYVSLGNPADFKKPITFIAKTKIFLLRSENQFSAVSAVCTHLGCTVQLAERRNAHKQFQCPCHGSEYDFSGNVTHGPAKKSLSWFQLQLDRNKNELILNRQKSYSEPRYLHVNI